MPYKSNGNILQHEKISPSVMKMLSVWRENELKSSISNLNPFLLLSHTVAVLVFGLWFLYFFMKNQ